MNNELLKIMTMIKPKVRSIVDSGEQHIPIIFILDNSMCINVMSMDLPEETKQIFKPILTRLLRDCDAQGYVMVTESWGATLSIDNPAIKDLKEGKIKVVDLPLDDRYEMISLFAVDKEGNTHTEVAKIKDTIDKRYLEDFIKIDSPFDGRMIVTNW